MSGYGKPEAHSHAGGITLNGGVYVPFASGKVNDFVELARNLRLGHAHDGTVHIDVLATGHLWMETGANLQKGSDTSAGADGSDRRSGDFREELQQGALPRTVFANDTHHVTLFYLEVYIA